MSESVAGNRMAEAHRLWQDTIILSGVLGIIITIILFVLIFKLLIYFSKITKHKGKKKPMYTQEWFLAIITIVLMILIYMFFGVYILGPSGISITLAQQITGLKW